MLASEDKKKALTSPSSVFKHPGEVVACGDLSKAEKTAILKQWEVDARLLQVATEEGMSEGEHSLFADVKKAQGKLDVDVLEEDGAPTKIGPLDKEMAAVLRPPPPLFAIRRSARPTCSEFVLNATVVLRRASGNAVAGAGDLGVGGDPRIAVGGGHAAARLCSAMRAWQLA